MAPKRKIWQAPKHTEIAKVVKHRNKSQMKERENSTEEGINEMLLSKLSKVECRVIIMGKLNSMSKEFNSMNKDTETIKINQFKIKNHQTEMKNDTAEIKNTLEGITSKVDETKDRISGLEDRVEKNHPIREPKRKKTI
uniref:Uncharacterized protein n=1 Tax=Molossus molossus TaxID=27622 RepID=A0A7J8JWS0_MOLMO|nr:hypothetical protein HJG59_007982 [Molossus molossus]